MKHLIRLITVGLLSVVMSSCGDSHDKLMNDQVSWMEEMTETLNGVADGTLSSSEAAERLEALGREGEEFVARKQKLNEGASPEEMIEVAKKHSEEVGKAFQDYMEAMTKLSASGRMTRELSEAIANMKTP